MAIIEAIQAINQMQADGVIERYAIVGEVGANFYLEPVATLNVDIFAAFKSDPASLIVNPQPIFDYLKARGCAMEGEYVVIGGCPVQFLPPGNPLVEEALEESVNKDLDETRLSVFTAEHLGAIALPTGRAKDKARLLQFIDAGALDAARFQAILARHSLLDAWRKFERQFLSDVP
jgi:hypothetical protein